MFGTSSYLDKSMNGIKTIFDGAGAVIQNGNATFNNITVTTLTADNLSDCNLVNCTADDPTDPQDIANKEYCDDNFVDRVNNLDQDVNGVKTFLSIPICTTSATTDFQLINKKYAVDNFVDRTNNLSQNINGSKTFSNSTTFSADATVNTALICNTINARNPSVNTSRELWTNLTTASTIEIGTNNTPISIKSTTLSVEGETTFSQDINTPNIFCNDALYLNDYQSGTTYSSILVQNTDILNFDANFNNNKFQFKVSSNAVLLLDATNTTIYNNLVSNNITSPSVTGTNNIYTNLSLDGGIINVGAKGSNININCNLNIIESAYGNTTKITTINQEGDSCRFTNNGSTNGDFIFSIIEGTTYNPLVINKTSIDIDGDANVSGNLILYDTTPSTKNVIIGMVGSDLFFTPYLNTPSSTYNFKVSDSGSNITTPLIINSTNTTIANNLICNSQATFNTLCPISNTSATADNHLTTRGFVLGQGFTTLAAVQANNNTFTGTAQFNQTVGVTGVLTATGNLKTEKIVAISTGGTQYIYNDLTAGGSITMGTVNRSINFFGTCNFNNNCQFSGALQSDDLTPLPNQLGSAQGIYTNLTSGGSITIGSNTANTTTYIRGGSLSIGNLAHNLTIESPTRFNTKINFYSGTTNNTEFLQTGTQLTIKPVSNNGSLALYSTNSSGSQTEQLLVNNSGVSTTTLNSTNIFSTNYNTPTQFLSFASGVQTGNCNICSNITTGNINIGNTTAGSFKTNIRGSLFSTGQATFQNFCPKTDTDPAVANDLVKLSYLQNNFCDLGTTQSIGGVKTFSGDITAPNINCNIALYFTDIGNNLSPNKPQILMLNDVVYFDTLAIYDNYWEFVCAGNIQLSINQIRTEIKNPLILYENATFSKQATFSEDIKHRETQILNKIKTISTTSPAAFEFPLEERWMFTSSGTTQINVTLPELTLSSQAGFNFSFFKTASITNSVLFTCQGNNTIRGINSITDLTSLTRISGTGTTGGFYTAEVSTGSFVWISY